MSVSQSSSSRVLKAPQLKNKEFLILSALNPVLVMSVPKIDKLTLLCLMSVKRLYVSNSISMPTNLQNLYSFLYKSILYRSILSLILKCLLWYLLTLLITFKAAFLSPSTLYRAILNLTSWPGPNYTKLYIFSTVAS